MRATCLFSLLTIALVGSSALANPLLPSEGLSTLSARGNLSSLGKKCTASTQCKSGFCNRSKCDTKKEAGKSCYKDVGCVSNKCGPNGKCATVGRKVGSSCSESTQCASGYCGRSKCAIKVENGQSCYKNVGCTSGFCVKSVCSASGSTVSPVDKSNFADFSSGTLGAWTASPADKVQVVADAASPGGYVARLTAGQGVKTSIIRDGISPAAGQQKRDDTPSALGRRDTYYHLDAFIQYRIIKLEPTNDANGFDRTQCYVTFVINGIDVGGQFIADVRSLPPVGTERQYGVWYTISNGIVSNTNQISSLQLGSICHENAIITLDIRNATQTVTFLGTD